MTSELFRAEAPPDAAALAAHLLAAPTATAALEAWCAARGIGEGPVRIARITAPPCPAFAAEARAALGAGALVHRRVSLERGAAALSDAEIWYAPDRLPAELARALETGDRPFGAVVAPLGPRREARAVVADPGPGFVLELRALIRCARGHALALTCERYRAGLVTG